MGDYNNVHSYVKLAPELFDAKLGICTIFPDKPGEGSTQALTFGCRFGSRQNIDAHHDTEIDLRICENGLSKARITRVTCIC
jgi:hypothetical protein